MCAVATVLVLFYCWLECLDSVRNCACIKWNAHNYTGELGLFYSVSDDFVPPFLHNSALHVTGDLFLHFRDNTTIPADRNAIVLGFAAGIPAQIRCCCFFFTLTEKHEQVRHFVGLMQTPITASWWSLLSFPCRASAVLPTVLRLFSGLAQSVPKQVHGMVHKPYERNPLLCCL